MESPSRVPTTAVKAAGRTFTWGVALQTIVPQLVTDYLPMVPEYVVPYTPFALLAAVAFAGKKARDFSHAYAEANAGKRPHWFIRGLGLA